MMRLLLGIASLMLVWVFTSANGAELQEPTLPKGRWPQQITGQGLNEKSAREAAFRAAVNEIKRLMQEQTPPLTAFNVDEEYVSKHLLSPGGGHAGKELRLEGFNDPFKEWVLQFRDDTNWWKDIVRRDQAAQRQVQAETRQTFLFRVIVGLTGLLLASFGYVRLDEFTRYKYTTWLRIATVAVLGAASLVYAGWWMS